MSNTLASSYKAILTGYSPFEYNQQVRNLTYNAHRAMNQTIESDRFEGLKQRYDRMQTIHQDNETNGIADTNPTKYNRDGDNAHDAFVNYRKQLEVIATLNALYKEAFGKKYEHNASAKKVVAKDFSHLKAS
mgnify:FL=1|tara:strand:+ start:563 stop:958 length:396 start_codon:yes stop_codon:yes gene_type:complete